MTLSKRTMALSAAARSRIASRRSPSMRSTALRSSATSVMSRITATTPIRRSASLTEKVLVKYFRSFPSRR